MRCPHCTVEVLEHWQKLYAYTDAKGVKLKGLTPSIPNTMGEEATHEFNIDVLWMECPNGACGKIIVQIEAWLVDTEADDETDDGADGILEFNHWIAFPKLATGRPTPPGMPPRLADDYGQAAAILPLSAKASAAISRRLLADLLEEYGGYKQFQLSKRIEAFAADPAYPESVKENVRYLVELGDFAAHTQKDQITGEIVDVEEGEAEWTLDVIDGLIECFITQPERNKARRAAIDAKVQRTGRKPVKRSKP